MDLTLFAFGSELLTLCSLYLYVLIFIASEYIIFTICKVLKSHLQSKNLYYGRLYGYSTIKKYVIYTITFILLIKSFSALLSAPLLGSAGLLVGIGLSLQNAFSDFFGGLIKWLKGNIEAENVLDTDGIIGQVTIIGSLTFSIKSREDFTNIIPNSNFLKQRINGKQNNAFFKYKKLFGISCKSEINFDEKFAHGEIKKDAKVVLNPASAVQPLNFGESLLSFGLMFRSDNLVWIKKVKSTIRKNLFK